MTVCMLGEHTMTINFSYRAIQNLTLDRPFFSKWPPNIRTCLNISVSKSLGNMILVSIYTFQDKVLQKRQ